MTNIQLYIAIWLPVIAVLVSMTINLFQISGMRDEIRGIREDMREIRSDLKILTEKRR